MRPRRAALVGPGRLGTLVAHALTASGIPVVRVAGGSAPSRARLQAALAGVRDVPLEEVAQGVDLVVVATPDGAIAEVVDHLVRADALDESHGVIHLAGVHGLAPLRRAGLAGARIAALHPVVTAPVGTTDPTLLHGVAWAVTTVAGDRAWAHAIVEGLGGDAFDVPEEDRVRYHAALALASNAVGAAVVLSLDVGGAIYADWYVPSLAELHLLVREARARGAGGFEVTFERRFVTSTLGEAATVITFQPVRGETAQRSQTEGIFLRPVRRFSEPTS